MYSIKLALKTVTYLYFEAVAYSRSTNIKSGLEMNAYVYLRRIYAGGQRKRPKARLEASLSFSRRRLSLDDL